MWPGNLLLLAISDFDTVRPSLKLGAKATDTTIKALVRHRKRTPVLTHCN